MILISGTIDVSPDYHDTFVGLSSTVAAATQNEPGCEEYSYWSDPSTPGRFRVFEIWSGEEALNTHMGSAHMAEFLGAMANVTVTGISINRYEVSAVSRFM